MTAGVRGDPVRVGDRDCLAASPRELGVSPATAHPRLKEWETAGVFARLHNVLRERLNPAGRIDWSASVVDGSHIRALQGALTGPSTVDRARTGSKHHLIVDPSGIPLGRRNRNDVTQLLPLAPVDAFRQSLRLAETRRR
jgi:hypothetical protein